MPRRVQACPGVQYIKKILNCGFSQVTVSTGKKKSNNATKIPAYKYKHGLRTPRESFFLKIPNFWAWADKLSENLGHYTVTQSNRIGSKHILTKR